MYTALRLGLFLLTWAAVTGAWLLVFDKAALGLTFLIALVQSLKPSADNASHIVCSCNV